MSPIRRLLERYSRDRVIYRHLSPDLGGRRLAVSPDAALSLWRRKLESDLFDFARGWVRPADQVWDVGANVGLFTFAAAHLAGPRGGVVAMEPDTFLVSLLRRSVSDGQRDAAPVEVLGCAVADAAGIAELSIAGRGRASNHLSSVPGASQQGDRRESIQVMTVSLDWLLEHRPPPAVVKIDVETAESLVLQGSQRLLSQVRPVILLEVSRSNSEAVTQTLRRADYRLFEWSGEKGEEVDLAAPNTLALPPGGSKLLTIMRALHVLPDLDTACGSRNNTSRRCGKRWPRPERVGAGHRGSAFV